MIQEILADQIPSQRSTRLELVRKWADVNTDALLEEDCHSFSIPEIEGFIGYKIASKNAVVFGDPVCSPRDKAALALAFDEDCKRKNLGVVYTIVSQDFAQWASVNLSAVMIEFGIKFVFDPRHNPAQKTGSNGVLVRKKVKQALKDGVVVKEYLGHDPKIEKQIEEVADIWLKKRHGPQIYLAGVTLFKDRLGKRWFYACKGDRILGFLLINEVQSQKGWLLNNVMMTPDSSKGLSELLIISTLETLDQEGCRFVLAGPVPLKDLGIIVGLGKVANSIIRFVFKIAKYFFNLEGHATFWNKFQPQYQSSFLLFPHKNLRASSIKAIFQALNASKG